MRLVLKSRKGITAQEILTMICILAAYLVLLIFVLPQVLGMIFHNFSLFSADVVARDMSSLITASGIATDRIAIYYAPSEVVEYNVEIKDRFVNVKMLKPADKQGEERKVLEEANAKIAIDVAGNFEAKKQFTIDKSRAGGKNIYGVEAK